jgi:hypothetical protein
MSPNFHVDAGPCTIDVQLDGSGIRVQRGPISKSIAWGKIAGATLVRPGQSDDLPSKKELQRATQFLGQDAVDKFQQLQGKVGEIFVAYHDEKNLLQQNEVPVPLTDPAFLQEFQTHLGNRWLGETHDRQQVAKKLHNNLGFFQTIFVLVALFAIIAIIAAIALLGFLGPVLNFMSIQKMLLDLQDGNYASLASRVVTYVALFILGCFLHRIIRARLDAMKLRSVPRRNLHP